MTVILRGRHSYYSHLIVVETAAEGSNLPSIMLLMNGEPGFESRQLVPDPRLFSIIFYYLSGIKGRGNM